MTSTYRKHEIKNHTISLEDMQNDQAALQAISNPYPLHVFHPKIKPFLHYLTSPDGFDIPSSFVGTDLLLTYSAAIGAGYLVSTNGEDGVPLVVWGCKIGISSSGKTLSWKKVGAPIMEIQDKFDQDWKDATKGLSNAQLVDMQMLTILLRDIYSPTLIKLMPSNPKGMMKMHDELIEFINGMDGLSKKEGTDTQLFMSIWNCEPYTAIRSGNQKFTNPRPFVAIGGGTQYKILPKFFEKNRDTSGFVFRFLFCRPYHDRIAEPNTSFMMPADAKFFHHQSVTQMFHKITVDDAYDNPRLIVVSHEASAFYNKWVKDKINMINAMPDLFDKDVRSSILGKIKEYILRFAGLLAISDVALNAGMGTDGNLKCFFGSEERIDSGIMQRAIQLGEYYYQEMVDIYDYVQTSIYCPKDVLEFSFLWKSGKYKNLHDIYKLVYPGSDKKLSNDAMRKRAERSLVDWIVKYPKVFNSNSK
jgi:hypothetical protein